MFHKGQIMGIVNVTPDSFSDGGDFLQVEQAIAHGERLLAEGADLLDIGGQSTRPGYQEVSPEEEMARIIPVITGLRKKSQVAISVDTYYPEVAKAALNAGATIINDIKGLDQSGMVEVVADYQAPVIIMHSRPRRNEFSLVEDLQNFYQEKITLCQKWGIPKEKICFDPGLGFEKDVEENIEILKNPAAFRYQDYPLLYGVSRKRTIAALTKESNPKERDFGSVAASLFAMNQGVELVRVHHVKGMKDSLRVWQSLAED